MARMVPSEIPDSVRADASPAEIRVYEELKRQLPDGLTVYYSKTWWDFQANGGARVGEVDFIVAGADWGIVVIEVKGGTIERDGVRDVWTSTDRRGRVHEIKNPIKQAERSMYFLRDRLNKFPCFRRTPVKIGCAVILPDCSAFRREMGIDVPMPLFLWHDDLDDLRTTLTSILERQGARIKIGGQGMEALHELLAPSLCLDLRFGSVVGGARRRIKELTEEQFCILDVLRRHHRAAITGGAGTGKTVLALEKARRLAGEGKATLLICYSDGLGAHLKEQVALWRLPNLTACTYNEFAATVCREADVNIPLPPTATDAQKTEYYERILPEALWGVLATKSSPRFDAVIVDEAQDFSETWVLTLELLLRDAQSSCWYVFYDNNQKILGNSLHRDAELSERFGPPFPLTRNLRNVPEVFRLFAQYYHGDGQGVFECRNDCQGNVSFHPELRQPADLVMFVSALVEREGIDPSDIKLLTCRHWAENRFDLKDVARRLQAKGIGVTATSVGKFKGLESAVVVLTDVDAAASSPGVLYTAISRAQLRLCVVGVSELPV